VVEVFVLGGGFANNIKEYLLLSFLMNLSTNYSMVEVVEIVEVSFHTKGARQASRL
jgi:hypothetical protein